MGKGEQEYTVGSVRGEGSRKKVQGVTRQDEGGAEREIDITERPAPSVGRRPSLFAVLLGVVFLRGERLFDCERM